MNRIYKLKPGDRCEVGAGHYEGLGVVVEVSPGGRKVTVHLDGQDYPRVFSCAHVNYLPDPYELELMKAEIRQRAMDATRGMEVAP